MVSRTERDKQSIRDRLNAIKIDISIFRTIFDNMDTDIEIILQDLNRIKFRYKT